jgi:hypothetical protein
MSVEEIKKALEGVTPDRLRYEADAMFAAIQGEQYGDTFHAYNWADKPHRVLYDAIDLMRNSASTVESLQRENEELKRDLSHEASHRQKLQNALAYWMPGVTKEIEISTNGRCGDDALLLVGSEGPFDDKCWGNEAIARAEAAEADVKRLREALQNVMGCYDTPLSRRRFPPDGFMTEAINTARTALASTGGEHHGN